MKYSSLFLISLMASSTASLASVVQVRSGEHTNFTRVALRIAEPIGYKMQISEGNIKISFKGDDVYLDVGSAMDRLSSGRVRHIGFNQESNSLDIRTISGALVAPMFESPYLYFDIYNESHSASSDIVDNFSESLEILDPNQFDLMPSSKSLMKASFHTRGAWNRWKQTEAKLDLPLLIGVDEVSSTSSETPDLDCYSEGDYQVRGNNGDFIADLRSSRRGEYSDETSEIFRRWNLVKEEGSLAGRKGDIAVRHNSRRDVYNGGMIFNFELCKDRDVSDFSQSSLTSKETDVDTLQKTASRVGPNELESLEVPDKSENGGFEDIEDGATSHSFTAYEENKLSSLDAINSYDDLNRKFLATSFADDKIVGDFYESILANDDPTLLYRYFSISQISKLNRETISKLKNRIRGDGYSWLSQAIVGEYNDPNIGRNK